MRIWDKEDLLHDCDAPFKDIAIPECVVEFEARAFAAPCGCTEIRVMTPFGILRISKGRCGKHMHKSTIEI